MIIEMGGVEYAEKKIAELSNNAKRELDIFDDNESKSALISAINFNIERKSQIEQKRKTQNYKEETQEDFHLCKYPEFFKNSNGSAPCDGA